MIITVCVASIGRNSLLETLDSLSGCKLQPEVSFNVVIADDSSNEYVARLLRNQSKRWFFPIKIVRSASSNIAIARNHCLFNASGEYLAFIDDDETADKDWLYNFVTLAKSSNADVIFGPVDAIYPNESPQWVCMAKPFMKRVGESGTKVTTGSTCNAFVKRAVIDKFKLIFRPDLGQSGGEDTAFFSELSKYGATLIASDDSMVYEKVPLERLTVSHLSRRYIRGGQTYASLFFSSRSIAFKISAYLAALVKVIIFFFLVIFFYFFRKNIALKYAFKLWLNLGKIRNLLNIPLINLYVELP